MDLGARSQNGITGDAGIHKEVILLPYVRQKSLYRNAYSTFNRESLKWILYKPILLGC